MDTSGLAVEQRADHFVGRDRDLVLCRRVGAGSHVGLVFLERGDAVELQAIVFGREVAVDLGMARLVAAVAAFPFI